MTTETGEYDHRITSILTEHFGYPPLAVVDDVINAVNHILYKCTQAMETYLSERKQEKQQEYEELIKNSAQQDILDTNPAAQMWMNLPKDEISLGTAKLETLLESQVDKNFDKFELYALRNILTIPEDLVDQGYVRLQHHENLEFKRNADRQNDEAVNKLIKDIRLELKLRELLKIQTEKGKQIVEILKKYSHNLRYLNENEINKKLSEKGKKVLKDLSPLDENLYFILEQVNTLITQLQTLYEKFEKNKNGMHFKPSLRDLYINGKSFKLLESIGVHVDEKNVDLLDPSEFQQ